MPTGPDIKNPTPVLWPDEPLGPDDEDKLNRGLFVSMIAERLNAAVLGQASTVFGLVGPWGSGKTSLLSRLRSQLDETWKVVVFSPWATSDVNSLQIEFLSALTSIFDETQQPNAKEKVRKYSRMCTSLLKIVPVAGEALSSAVQEAVEVATAEKPWREQFEQACDVFCDLGYKVLIIADDIDRLDSEEVLSLLKVVRLLGRFPNVHYLIAYDQTTIEDLLKFRGLATKSSDFMEKIVQYPFEVPPLAAVVQRRLLTETIDELIARHGITLDAQAADRLSELVAVIAPALLTPRAQSRFREQVLAFAEMLSFAEVDAIDYVALSFIRVFHHEVYEQIAGWKVALQSGKVPLGFLDSSELSHEDWHNRIRPLVETENDVSLIMAILSGLFPGIQSQGLIFYRDHPLALSNDLYFQRYFIMGIADDDVEDRIIANAITRIVDNDVDQSDVIRFAEIIDGDDLDLAALALEKGAKFRGSHSSGSPKLVEFLIDRHNANSDGQEGFASPLRALRRWLDSEIMLALTESALTVDRLKSIMAAPDILLFATRSIASNRLSSRSPENVVADLGVYFLDILENELLSALSFGISLAYLVDTCWWFTGGDKGDERVSDIGTRIANVYQRSDLEKVIVGFVIQEDWVGSDGLSPELRFQEASFRRLFGPEATRELDGKLLWYGASKIDTEDLSLGNRLKLARAKVAEVARN
ncbi:KAP family P-loop NTPase fold protein [Mycolicibacterium neoaurum]|uniref:P-loop ATPase n=1 Tax=Mycolicibacterium neoaurum TaxID=1795 RepID=A0AAV2WMD3_MYCNE|nr:P-loop NTPase fold protein [Mycolicibacterium neoaurum]TLH57122.1 hypothetical protein C1S81_17420 [Mycolicibacterium neoaurum]CDQ45519.1 putative P-loop ATPase [Mycolicibacterium neoaurum]